MYVNAKKCISLLCLIFLCFLMESEVYAAGSVSYTPRTLSENAIVQWVNTTSVKVNLSFDVSKAICGACVIGKADTSEIEGTVVLSRKNSNGTYTTVKTWSNLKTEDNLLIFDNTYYVTKGNTYRLTITATVNQNGTGETVSGYYEASSS